MKTRNPFIATCALAAALLASVLITSTVYGQGIQRAIASIQLKLTNAASYVSWGNPADNFLRRNGAGDMRLGTTDGGTDGDLTVGTLTATELPFVSGGIARVTGSNATTTGQALVDVTGLSVALAASATYTFDATLTVSTSAVTTGTKYAVQFSAAGASVEAQFWCSLTATASAISERVNALNTATTTACLTTSAQSGAVLLKGVLVTGVNTGNLTIQHLKVTSGTSTVFINSFLKATRIA